MIIWFCSKNKTKGLLMKKLLILLGAIALTMSLATVELTANGAQKCEAGKCETGKCAGAPKKAPALKCEAGKCETGKCAGAPKKVPAQKCEAGKCAAGKCAGAPKS